MRLRDQLSSDRRYEVPDFQRNYSWKGEHVEEFLDDLIEHLKKDDGKYYFFGTVYLEPITADGNYKIVDGQQRFATTFIFLAAVRDLFIEYDQEASAREVEEYLKAEDRKEPRLKLNSYNNEFFQNTILARNKIADKLRDNYDHQNVPIAETYKTCYNRLKKEITNGDPGENLRMIYCHLLKYFVNLVIETNKESQIHRIFNTVNQRGMRLHESDYVKNGILEIAEAKSLDTHQLNDSWFDLLDTLAATNTDESDFLRHYLIAFHERVSTTKVADTIIDLASNPDDLLHKLQCAADDYKKLKQQEVQDHIPKNLSINQYDILRGAIALKSKAVYPALLKGYTIYKNDTKKFNEFAEVIMIFFFRARTIGRSEANSIEERINLVCRKLVNSNVSISDIKKILSEAPTNPSDDDFRAKFSTFKPTNEVARYILSKINGALNNDKEMYWNQTVEHVMPRNFDKWEKDLMKMPGISTRHDLIDFHKNYLKRLGNLTLLTARLNPKIGNKDFKTKRSEYDNPKKLKITQSIINSDKWDKNSIVKRQNMFADLALKIWKL